jgi:hypothetical protein
MTSETTFTRVLQLKDKHAKLALDASTTLMEFIFAIHHDYNQYECKKCKDPSHNYKECKCGNRKCKNEKLKTMTRNKV